MKRSWSDTMPPSVEQDGDGSYLYRWDVREETRETEGMDNTEPAVSYSYNEVRVWPTLTPDKVLLVCMTYLYGDGLEQKLMNDYNAVAVGLLGDKMRKGYTDMLETRKALKRQIANDFGFPMPDSLQDVKEEKLLEIARYDSSPAVNTFMLGDKRMWLSKSDRVGLVNSVTIEKAAGREATRLWFGGETYEIPVDAALDMLSVLEIYALECYNVTASHRKAVEDAETLEEAMNYDYTAGYPEKLKFNI